MIDASSPAPDPAPRRALLRLADNPEPALDYLVTLRASLPDGSGVEIRCVPDRHILQADCISSYIQAVPAGAPEAVTAMILGDLSNELLPRWLRVTITAAGPIGHQVVMEDRRPRWDNPALLGRLAPL